MHTATATTLPSAYAALAVDPTSQPRTVIVDSLTVGDLVAFTVTRHIPGSAGSSALESHFLQDALAADAPFQENSLPWLTTETPRHGEWVYLVKSDELPVGFIAFNLRAADCYGVNPGSTLRITLTQAYVCAGWEHGGVLSALVESVASVVEHELARITHTLLVRQDTTDLKQNLDCVIGAEDNEHAVGQATHYLWKYIGDAFEALTDEIPPERVSFRIRDARVG